VSQPVFMQAYAAVDPEVGDMVDQIRRFAMEPGALDARTKVLIALALDALHGAPGGVKALAGLARRLGADEAAIAETLRVVYYVAGVQALAAGAAAFSTD